MNSIRKPALRRGALMAALVPSAFLSMALESAASPPQQLPPPVTYDWAAAGVGLNDRFGVSISIAGDVNGDGFADFVVGIPGQGSVRLFFGSATGLDNPPYHDWQPISGLMDGDGGMALATADVNGDGCDDIFVGQPYADPDGESNAGLVSGFFGRFFDTPAPIPDWNAEGSQSNAALGRAVATGDVNGDGYDDVIIGAPSQAGNGNDQLEYGIILVYHGSPEGLPTSPDWTAFGDTDQAHAGSLLATGDLNGDGFDDVISGMPLYDGSVPSSGRVVVYLGSASGLGQAPAWSSDGVQQGERFGRAVAAGDFDGDGFDDLVIGAPFHDGVHADSGQVRVYPGSAAGPSASPGRTLDGAGEGARLGMSLWARGDVDGDARRDLIVEACQALQGPDETTVFIHFGNEAGLSPGPDWITPTIPGWGLGLALSAGDLNGDGLDDVGIGAQYFLDLGVVSVYYARGFTVDGLEQVRLDGQTPIPPGRITPEDGFVAIGSAGTSSGAPFRLEVEVTPVGGSFSGGLTASGEAVPEGQPASASVAGLEQGVGYRWRARVRSLSTGWPSPWRHFGSEGPEADLAVLENLVPSLFDPVQKDPFTGASLPVGAAFPDGRARFQALIADPDGDLVRLEIEVRRVGEAFTGSPSSVGALIAGASTAFADAQLGPGSYRWRCRAADGGGTSPWRGFGGNPEDEADFEVWGGSAYATRPMSGCSSSSCDAGVAVLAWALICAAILTRNFPPNLS